MDDQIQLAAVGFVLLVALGAALALGGIVEFPTAEAFTNPVQAVSVDLDRAMIGAAPIELEIPGVQDEFNKEAMLDQYIYHATIRSLSTRVEAQMQGNSQTEVHSAGSCGLGY